MALTTVLAIENLTSRLIILVIALASCSFFFVLTRCLLYNSLRDIPGPFAARLSNLTLAVGGIKGRRVYALEALHHKYGDVVRVGRNEVSVANLRHVRTIYANSKTVVKDSSFYANATFVGKNNIFQMTNPVEHAARRKLSSPPYAAQAVGELEVLVQQKAESLAQGLLHEASASATGTADAFKLCGLFSFETICKAAFAKDFEGPDSVDDALKLMRGMDGSAPTLIFDGVFPFLRPTGLAVKVPGFVGDAYRSHQYWQQQSRIMVDHFLEKSSSDEKYLLSPIATGVDGFLGRRLNHEELVEEAMGYRFAGSGTTSSTLTYLLYALSLPENEHIQDRLYTEITALPPADVTALA